MYKCKGIVAQIKGLICIQLFMKDIFNIFYANIYWRIKG